MSQTSTFKRSFLRGTTALSALAILGTGLLAAPAMAQNSDTTEATTGEDEIVVTGTIFPRIDRGDGFAGHCRDG